LISENGFFAFFFAGVLRFAAGFFTLRAGLAADFVAGFRVIFRLVVLARFAAVVVFRAVVRFAMIDPNVTRPGAALP
jgi:hypothetical protein